MGSTIAQKILASHSGRGKVDVGDIVTVKPDYVLSHDNSAAIIKKYEKLPVDKIFDPLMPVIVLDHTVPASTSKYANNHKSIREFVKYQEIPNFYDMGEGICHQVLSEKGFAFPGGLILGADSHTTTYGAFGAASAGIGRSEVAAIWATGEMWLKVPKTIKINIEGQFLKYITSKDLILKIIGDLGADGALYKSVEFTGDTVKEMSIDSRMVLSNMAVEMGAKFGIIYPDKKVDKYLENKAKKHYKWILPDSDAVYLKELNYNVNDLEPYIAKPHTVDNVSPVVDTIGQKIDQVFFGSCTNGRLEDFHAAAELLKGRKIAKNVRMLAFPASKTILQQIISDGTAQILLDAGVILMNTGCGPCLGAHEGVLADNEVCISTANRNFKGRLGNPNSFIYLASPYTAVASAITGVITDPREMLS